MGLLATVGGIAGSFFGGPIGGMVGSALGGAIDGSHAARSASQAQQQSAQQGIDFQREVYNRNQANLSPFMQAGQNAMGQMQPYMQAGGHALAAQQNLLGLNGYGQQQGAIDAISNSPLLQQLMKQGESAMLQNASATGGLRGGNLQGALAQYRPAMLQNAIDQQYSRLGGMTALGQMSAQNMAQMGQSAAATQATAGLHSANNISNLYNQQGAAQSGGILAQNKAINQGISGALGTVKGYGGWGNIFGGGASSPTGTNLSQANYAQTSGF